jgi:hypothetical protein
MIAERGKKSGRAGLWRIIGWGSAAALLLTPLVAMQFTDEVDWSLFDFVVMGAMMLAVGIPLELAARSPGSAAYRIGAAVALMTGFLLVWINLAVGLIGSEDNPLNLVFLAVVAVTAAGAVIVRGRAQGLAATMLVAAVVQGAISLAVLTIGWGAHEPPGLFGVAFLIGAFAVLWLVAAALFRRAAASAG